MLFGIRAHLLSDMYNRILTYVIDCNRYSRIFENEAYLYMLMWKEL